MSRYGLLVAGNASPQQSVTVETEQLIIPVHRHRS
jgi:hypothetical protein